jgi:hypothetical protein
MKTTNNTQRPPWARANHDEPAGARALRRFHERQDAARLLRRVREERRFSSLLLVLSLLTGGALAAGLWLVWAPSDAAAAAFAVLLAAAAGLFIAAVFIAVALDREGGAK